MDIVKHAVGLQAEYDAIAEKDENTIYFCTDSLNIYKGSSLFNVSPLVFNAAMGGKENKSVNVTESQYIDLEHEGKISPDVTYYISPDPKS